MHNGALTLLLQLVEDALYEGFRDLAKIWRRAIASKSCRQFLASADFDLEKEVRSSIPFS